MRRFLGMFNANKPRALQGVYDEPYLMIGRHVLCAAGVAQGGGVAALAVGRLRNAGELQKKICAAGIPIALGGGISEILLGAYRLWGEGCVQRLEGPIACVVIDRDAGRLLLSCDRMGEVRLFYAVSAESVCFAGHPAPLLNAPGVSRVVDRAGWCEVFGLGPARTPGRTPFRDIHQLEGGSVLTADERGARIRKYYALEARPHEDDLNQTIANVRGLIEQSVADIAPLRPASMLSGGVDSTLLTALIARHTGAPLRSFSVDYQDNSRYFPDDNAYQPDQDSPWVERAVRTIGTRHTRVELPIQSLFGAIEPAMEARGMPGMADIDSSLLLFGREIASSGRHALSGECGDEVFGGYPWFHRAELIDQDGFPWSGSLPLRQSALRPPVRRALDLAGYVSDRYHQAVEALPALPGEGAREARLRQLQGLCFTYFMPNLQERAACMLAAYGLTVLTPYSDDRLVQYVFNIPWQMKSLRGHEKGLMRAAMEGVIPDDLLWRKKSPYPKTYHPEYAQLAAAGLRAVLQNPASPILQLADRDALMRLLASPLSPAPWYGQLMAGPQMLSYLLQVNQWMVRYRVEVGL